MNVTPLHAINVHAIQPRARVRARVHREAAKLVIGQHQAYASLGTIPPVYVIEASNRVLRKG